MSSLIQEKLAHENTKMELYKAQFRLLDIMGQACMAQLAVLTKQLEDQQAQNQFDAAVDARDMPTGHMLDRGPSCG